MHILKLSGFFSFAILFAMILIFPFANTQETNPASRAAAANGKFGFKLLARIRQGDQSRNFLFSPASIGWCLGMALNGANGTTRNEISSAIEAKDFTLADFNQAYSDWEHASRNIDPKVELEIANSIWARKGLSLNPDFLNSTKSFFNAEVSVLDFNDPRSLITINAWVKNKTKNKIENIIDEIRPESILFLINAIYFNGKWTRAFDAAMTKNENFTALNGAGKQLPMMHQHGKFEYLERNEFQAIRLPYGSRRVSMDVYLPSEKMGYLKFLESVNAERWSQWNQAFTESEGDLGLPRFRVEYEVALNNILKSLGMKAAFDPALADFSAIVQSNQKPYISEVKHKAFAEVNEEGTEAAAVTSTEFRVASMPLPSKTFRMIVNRPFFFVIQDRTTQAVLFIGSVVSP